MLGFAAVAAQAQVTKFPARVVRITSPLPTGLAIDVTVRLIAERLGRAWGQQVLVEARPGANGLIAIGAVRKAPADGHDLLVVANSFMTINPHLIKSLPYDPENDFVPVSLISRAPFFVVVSATGPYRNLRDLIAAAKANPGRVSYSSPSVGSAPHIGGALLAYLMGSQMTAVDFKEGAPMFTSIVNGDVHFIVSTTGSAAPLIKAGKLRYIAAAAPTRIDLEPGVPSAKEAGGPPDYEVGTWTGIVAPRGTPAEIVRRISADVGTVLAASDMRERFRDLGFVATATTPTEMDSVIRGELRRYADLVKRIGITAE
jgi:tripartite-type tricarboxylate transporter receptor subunit TctC